MRLIAHLLPLLLAGILPSYAKDEATTITSAGDGALVLTGSITTSISEATLPTGDYLSYTSTITLSNDHTTGTSTKVGVSTVTDASSSGNATATTTSSRSSTSSNSVTLLVGGGHHTMNGTANATSTSTTSATSTPVVNTQPCNGYSDFCSRKYSNITMVAAHNSPFVKPGNAAANQAYKVTDQLNDGIRMLQFQTHLINGTLYLCHTSCEMLNVGTLEDYLTTVTTWIKTHPYDVVTILIGNYDYVDPGNFTAPVQNSGLMDYVWTPPKIPMALDDWPTLSNMILSGKRAVVFMDYQANQTAYPWLMDEFSQMWETPFSPTDAAFPCTEQRPPDLSVQDAKNRMYMANHNLNLDVSIGSISLLIPNTAMLNQTNAVSGYASLGLMAENCTDTWGRPPNFLLVDYYNYGNFNGSVFEVAAEMNNVTYSGTCCGTASAAPIVLPGPSMLGTLFLVVGVSLVGWMF
ncbi:PLC-like phosphodiesterase [Aspergillus japonicus CBS 114.51]|uniref:PLC-like phosphodiesterase n=2 Tax=Aspergillus TaxID=5052 RepID=A0A2V5HE20_ASPV1|nr:PLC-like phosphodiesterase [Aspergillus japonicus CBS 114.51]PYI21951.1 PLC-like phosphodiesterase [Aspergillus violaceofuscus CBS 115571]RAH81441.1 PLC-like phosphodiesterase [Aspergillus japonicus CBS 114.51]